MKDSGKSNTICKKVRIMGLYILEYLNFDFRLKEKDTFIYMYIISTSSDTQNWFDSPSDFSLGSLLFDKSKV